MVMPVAESLQIPKEGLEKRLKRYKVASGRGREPWLMLSTV